MAFSRKLRRQALNCTILSGAALLMVGLMSMQDSAHAATNASCGMDGTQKASGEPIVIGSIVGETGPADFSASAKAAKAYFDCVNEKGGINGRPVRYLVGDDQWNPEVAAQLAAKFVKDEGAVAMVGNSSFVECAANAQLYKENGIIAVAGVGVPRECFSASHYAPLNAGPRISTTGAAEYAGEQLGANSFVCIGPNIPNVGGWACDGVKNWAEANGKTSSTILVDPGSLDASSTVLQAAAYSPDAIVLSLPKDLMLPVLTAAEEQGFDQTIKFLSAASGYDLSVPGTLGEIWDKKFYVNMEFNALEASEADNQNWLAVMNAYAEKDDPRDTFAQAGYLSARLVTSVLLSLDADKISRESVTEAIGKAQAFKSDILCSDWYYGVGTERQNANHTTRMAVAENGSWKPVSPCRASGDPELGDILAYEKKIGLTQ